ncbi:uncharacterized protein V6R79_019947 [Siganus canaliculatus]
MWFGPFLCFFNIHHPDYVKTLLATTEPKDDLAYSFVESWIGCMIGTSVFGIHRNASVWENPNDFDPLRFLPENASKRSPHAFVPFSAGPRNCIGQTFAMNELKVATALVLKKYQLIEDPDLKPKLMPRLVLRSLNGIYIKIKPVDQQA